MGNDDSAIKAKDRNLQMYNPYLSAFFTAGHIDVSISFDIHVGNEQEWTLAY